MKKASAPCRRLAVCLAIMLMAGAPAANANSETSVTAALKAKVKTIVVIYAENRSFDNLFSNFPGANGIPAATGAFPARSRRRPIAPPAARCCRSCRRPGAA